MRIVVDVMGGDHGCGVVIEGVARALQASSEITELFLAGDQAEIIPALAVHGPPDSRVRVIHASEVMTMWDKPVEALRRKKDCSILRAVDLVRERRADALISPGNTGGLVAASTIRLRSLPGVERPGIMAVIPAPENEFVLLDSGANIECRPLHLAQYAVMGSVYSREILGYSAPRVGILSNGTEDTKGNELTLEAFRMCKKLDINFVGNVEGSDLFRNRVDVVVCDGFVGNIVLKTCEGLARSSAGWLKRELMKSPMRMMGALLARNALAAVKRRLDPEAHGGAPLLGVNGIVIKVHASASAKTVMNAVRQSTEAVKSRVNRIIRDEIARANALIIRPSPFEHLTPAAA